MTSRLKMKLMGDGVAMADVLNGVELPPVVVKDVGDEISAVLFVVARELADELNAVIERFPAEEVKDGIEVPATEVELTDPRFACRLTTGNTASVVDAENTTHGRKRACDLILTC